MEERGSDAYSDLLDPLMERLDGADFITQLQSQLKFLQIRELVMENAGLSSQISSCRCRTLMENSDPSVDSGKNMAEESRELSAGGDMVGLDSIHDRCEEETSKAEGREEIRSVNKVKKKKYGEISPDRNFKAMHHHTKRYIALKVMYFGQRFYGFASEAQMDPTVESEIFEALKKTRLLVCDKEESQYSRCGRTDKGVSSVGQVISLFLRSKLKDTGLHANYEKISPKNIEEEIDYVRVLNRALPKDIRVISWCPARIDFHARFSCLGREYKYLFWKENLDISAMEIAGKEFVGEHDFRSFCKMDAVNVHNYRRHITSFEICSCNERYEGDQLWAMTIKGSAFLWHQVRCMVAVLFMIGQGLESPSVIEALLDTNRTPRKPQYAMAPELPLVLQSCEFEGLDFTCSPDARQVLCEQLKDECKAYKLRAAIFQEALQSCSSTIHDESPLKNGKKKKKAAHIPLMSRPTEPSYEERCAKLKARAYQ